MGEIETWVRSGNPWRAGRMAVLDRLRSEEMAAAFGLINSLPAGADREILVGALLSRWTARDRGAAFGALGKVAPARVRQTCEGELWEAWRTKEPAAAFAWLCGAIAARPGEAEHFTRLALAHCRAAGAGWAERAAAAGRLPEGAVRGAVLGGLAAEGVRNGEGEFIAGWIRGLAEGDMRIGAAEGYAAAVARMTLPDAPALRQWVQNLGPGPSQRRAAGILARAMEPGRASEWLAGNPGLAGQAELLREGVAKHVALLAREAASPESIRDWVESLPAQRAEGLVLAGYLEGLAGAHPAFVFEEAAALRDAAERERLQHLAARAWLAQDREAARTALAGRRLPEPVRAMMALAEETGP